MKTVSKFLVKLVLESDLVKILTTSIKPSNDKIKEICNFQYLEYQNGIKDLLNKTKLQ